MITLLFTTRNGMQTLPAMLERLATIAHPRGLSIVAVDDGSIDGSGSLLRKWAERLPMQVLAAPVAGGHGKGAGKNRALNFALDQLGATLADSKLIVFTDDDVIACDGWLDQLVRAADAYPDADVFGGTIVPHWLVPVPEWLASLEDTYPILFAVTRATDGACTSHDIYGPNIAIRGRIFADGVRFDPRIGPDGTLRFGMGSESELLRRLERAGHRFVFRADALVRHQVKPSQLELAAVLGRGWRYGFGRAMMDRQQLPRSRMLRTAVITRFVREVKAVVSRLPNFADRRIKMLFWREVARGYLEASLQPSPSTIAGRSDSRCPAAAKAPVQVAARRSSRSSVTDTVVQ